MGPGVRRAFNWIYTTNVQTTPWLYDFFYTALWRHRWFANACRRFVGAWCGRRLRPVLRRHGPDLIISTYPLGTAGLNWLRRHGEAGVGVSAVVSDFAPHPFWVYPEIDTHYVVSDASLRAMYRAEPDAIGAVCAPPVVSDFHPRDKTEARRDLGVGVDGFTVLISCGALGFGSVQRAVHAALAVPEVRRVLVVCGRNDRLRHRLTAHADERLVPLGWVEDMPRLTACADVVVTNAGGATALEALACARAIIMFEPIAGHGRANAELMARAGLAELCPHEPELRNTLRRWATSTHELARREDLVRQQRYSAGFTEQTAALADLPRHRGRRPLRAQDAFFVYATTPKVSQQAAAVVRLEGAQLSTAEWYQYLADRIDQYANELPMLARVLIAYRHVTPQWMDAQSVRPGDHLECRDVHDERSEHEAAEEFLRTPVSTGKPPWELLLLRRAGQEHSLLLAKMHHALGDGVAVTNALLRLLCDGFDTPRPRAIAGAQDRVSRTFQVLRGLVSLASSGTAGPASFTGRSSTRRSIRWFDLPGADLRSHARALEVSSTALLLGLVAEALHHALGPEQDHASHAGFRVMVPKTVRTGRGAVGPETPGNHTVSVVLDLPVGPCSLPERITRVSRLLDVLETSGQAAATGFVLGALGSLPAALHRWVVRRIYQRRFFHAVVSVLPGRRKPAFLGPTRLASVHPVLSLADGVGVAIGAINWGRHIGFGITTDTTLAPDAGALTTGIQAAFAELSRGHEPSRDQAEYGGTAG